VIVRLTHSHQSAIRARVPQLYIDEIAARREPKGRRQHDISLPAIAWCKIATRLRRDGYGPMGGKTRGPHALYTGISRVQAAVNRIETHPAMSPRGAVMGVSGDEIPAWTTPDGYSPYPNEIGSFVILEPMPVEFDGHVVTRWHPRQPSGGEPELLQERFHLRFCIEV
jgi:hypothetical protein